MRSASHWLLDPDHNLRLMGLGAMLLLIVFVVFQSGILVSPPITPAVTRPPVPSESNNDVAKAQIRNLEWVKDVYVSPGYMNVGVIRGEKEWGSNMIGSAICGILQQSGSNLATVRFVDIQAVKYEGKSPNAAEIFVRQCD